MLQKGPRRTSTARFGPQSNSAGSAKVVSTATFDTKPGFCSSQSNICESVADHQWRIGRHRLPLSVISADEYGHER
jgi:hypothetical protein